jgi:hypothetical protein
VLFGNNILVPSTDISPDQIHRRSVKASDARCGGVDSLTIPFTDDVINIL